MSNNIIIKVANEDTIESLKEIIHITINAIYSKYYSKGVVDFFLKHHSYVNIKNSIIDETVLLLYSGATLIGTGSLKENEIKRVFILPEYQFRGMGTILMDTLEGLVLKKHDSVELDASLPGYEFYLNRGYSPIKYNKIITDDEDVLCYFRMVKS